MAFLGGYGIDVATCSLSRGIRAGEDDNSKDASGAVHVVPRGAVFYQPGRCGDGGHGDGEGARFGARVCGVRKWCEGM